MVDAGRPLMVLDQILEQYRVVQHGCLHVFRRRGASEPGASSASSKRLVKRTRHALVERPSLRGSVDGPFHPRPSADVPTLGRPWSGRPATSGKCKTPVGVPVAVENVSSYAEFHASEMTSGSSSPKCRTRRLRNPPRREHIYVSSKNHTFDPYTYLDAGPRETRRRSSHRPAIRNTSATSSTPTIIGTRSRMEDVGHAIGRVGRAATLSSGTTAFLPLMRLHAEALKAISISRMRGRWRLRQASDIESIQPLALATR